jgi:hypothetical protein
MEHFKEKSIVWRRLGVIIIVVHVAAMKIYIATIEVFKKNERGEVFEDEKPLSKISVQYLLNV